MALLDRRETLASQCDAIGHVMPYRMSYYGSNYKALFREEAGLKTTFFFENPTSYTFFFFNIYLFYGLDTEVENVVRVDT